MHNSYILPISFKMQLNQLIINILHANAYIVTYPVCTSY